MLNLHAILPRSRANGPGVRFAVWFQGCRLSCTGCFNPATHAFEPLVQMTVEALVERIVAQGAAVEGITLSGGEPMEQAECLLRLVADVRNATALSILLFSGYTLAEIQVMPRGPDILSHVDVLIAGRYDETRRLARRLRGSANQSIHLLTDRYTMSDIEATPPAEIRIDPSGAVTISGIAPPERT